MRHSAFLAVLMLVNFLGPMTSPPTFAQLVSPPMDELKLEAKSKDQKLLEIRRQLAEAEFDASFSRARLARAEGNRELAASEWRKVIRHREDQFEDLKVLIKQGRLCSLEPYYETTGALAIARVWLADLEGRDDVLRAELPPAIKYFEWKIDRYNTLLKRSAIHPEEATRGVNEAEPELRWARDRLAALPVLPSNQSRQVGS